MPHIICPPRSLIMLHVGNMPSETDGCVLVGAVKGIDSLGASRVAFAKLYPLIQAGCQAEGCSIQVFDPPAQPADLSSQGDV